MSMGEMLIVSNLVRNGSLFIQNLVIEKRVIYYSNILKPFIVHHSLANSMKNGVKMFTDLLFYAYKCWETPSDFTVFDNYQCVQCL